MDTDILGLGGTGVLAEGLALLEAWDCPPRVLDRLREMHRATGSDDPPDGSAGNPLQALLRSADVSFPWLARFGLDETLAALALLLGKAREAAGRAGTAGRPSTSTLPSSLLVRCEQFGAWRLKRALEDCNLVLSDPSRHREVHDWFHRLQVEQRDVIGRLLDTVGAALRQVTQPIEVRFDYCGVSGASRRLARLGRPAGTLVARPQQFGRVIVVLPHVADCYRALEAVHAIGQPEPGELWDLIATPRDNGYGGLLTSVWIDPGSEPGPASASGRLPVFKFAIQTRLMAELSWLGIAHPAVRRYLDGMSSEPPTAGERGLARLVRSLTGERASTITVFTTRGEALRVPSGATALDLAYRIHTEVGNHAVGVDVNGKRARLDAPLPPGASVTIITDPGGEGRSEGDLGLVAEPRHRRRIATFLNSEPVRKGRHMIVTYLRRHGARMELAEIDALATEAAERWGHPDATSLYRALAEAASSAAAPHQGPPAADRLTAGTVGAELLKRRHGHPPDTTYPVYSDPTSEWIPYLEDSRYGDRPLRLKLCAVCRPSRTVRIVGTERRGAVTVHLPTCHRVVGRRALTLRWQKVERTVRAHLSVLAWDRPRLLPDVLEPAYELNCGVEEVRAAVADGGRATVHVKVYLRSAVVLVKLLELLGHVSSVFGVNVEEASLPPPLLDRIRTGPRDERLLQELSVRGYGESSVNQVLIAPSFAPRRGAVRLPYTSNKPTHSPRSFVGRQADARWLAAHTVEAEYGGAALVLGPARVGKTSLCLRFLDQFPESTRPQIRRIDLRDLRSQGTEAAFALLLTRLRTLTPDSTGQPPTAAGVVEAVRRGVEACRGRHVVLVLDEFGGPVRALADGTLGEEFFDVIPLLMDLRLPLSLVLVAVPEAHTLMHRTGLWHRLRACRDRELGALEPAEAREMIVRPFAEQGVQWDERAVDRLLHQSGRLPLFIIFLLQEVAYRLNLNTQKQYVQAEDVRAAAAKLLRSGSAFGYWLERLNSPVKRSCMRAVLEHGQRGSIEEGRWREAVLTSGAGSEEEFDEAVNSLVVEGIMVREASKYCFAVPMFWSWLDLNLTSSARARALGLGG